MAQPPLTRQVRTLEAELGVQLFRRSKRKVELTEVGTAFLGEARLAIEQAERAAEVARRASRGEIGRLTVGFISTAAYAVVPEVLRVFRERYPGVELGLRELTPADQLREFEEGRLDIGFLRPPVDEGSLVVETVMREPLVAALPEGHPLSGRSEVPLRELARERFVLFPRAVAPGFYDEIVALCRDSGFSPRVAQEATQQQTIVSLVAGGVGVALVPASVRNLRRLGVRYAELEERTPTAEIAVAWRRDDDSPVVAAFLEVVRATPIRQSRALPDPDDGSGSTGASL
jgi:DNA-binding transcriptional LysR family regulator